MKKEYILYKIKTKRRENRCGIDGCKFEKFYFDGMYIVSSRKKNRRKKSKRIKICKYCNYSPNFRNFVFYDENKMRFFGRTPIYVYDILDNRVKVLYNNLSDHLKRR